MGLTITGVVIKIFVHFAKVNSHFLLLVIIIFKSCHLKFLFQRCAKKCPDQNALGWNVNVSDLVCDYDTLSSFDSHSPGEVVNNWCFQRPFNTLIYMQRL